MANKDDFVFTQSTDHFELAYKGHPIAHLQRENEKWKVAYYDENGQPLEILRGDGKPLDTESWPTWGKPPDAMLRDIIIDAHPSKFWDRK